MFQKILILALMGTPFMAADPIRLNGLPLLFADDSAVQVRQTLVRTIHPGTKHDAPVLVADQPWEIDRVYAWGSVYWDESLEIFRMWYLARVPVSVEGGEALGGAERASTNLLYATSTDGLHWDKPALGLHRVLGSSANNIFDTGGGGSATILMDNGDPDKSKRFKMIAHRKGGYHALYSADGIHWNPYPENPVLTSGDTVMLARDPRTGEYLAYHKRPATIRGFPRRVIWLSRSTDFQHWSGPVMVIAPDEADDDWFRGPEDRMEVYDMPVFPHASGFIGFPAMFRMMPQKLDGTRMAGNGIRSREGGAVTDTGPIDIQLATSPNGKDWRRTSPRIAIIPRGLPGTYDGGAVLNTATAPVTVGDQTWVYYTAINTGHGAPIPPKAIAIGRADWRRYGFVSIDAGPEGGSLITKPLTFASGALRLNADSSRGELRAAILEEDGSPIEGYGFADSAALTSDSTNWIASWKNQKSVPTDRPVRVALQMSNTALFSLESSPDSQPR